MIKTHLFRCFKAIPFSTVTLATAIISGGCGGGNGGSTPVPTTTTPTPISTPPAGGGNLPAEDVSLVAPNGFFLTGVSPLSFNHASSQLYFKVVGTEFDPNPNSFTLKVNNTTIPSTAMSRSSTLISANVSFGDGLNKISAKAFDKVGRPLFINTTFWSGSGNVQVRLVDDKGALVMKPTNVQIKLAEQATVGETATSSNGTVTFKDVPPRTVIVEAQTTDKTLVGVGGGVGSGGIITVHLSSFGSTSPIDNNDFSQGTAGWEVGSASVSIIPHVEGNPTLKTLSAETIANARNGMTAPRVSTKSLVVHSNKSMTNAIDADLSLATEAEGPTTISRTFNIPEGTSSVKARFRFITSEVPGGYFGSQYNDYYSIVLRSQKNGGNATETNTMNGLGLSAFDFASGATPWRTLSINTDPKGDSVQIEATVANVADGALDSAIVLDNITTDQNRVVPTLQWNSQQGGLALGYTVTGTKSLDNPVTITVNYASAVTYESRIGGAVYTLTVPQGTPPGSGTPVNIPGAQLQQDPGGTQFIMATSSPSQIAYVPDVTLTYGANANSGLVSAGMVDLLKDALRVAGQQSATITSTARTAEDQARAMFQNLTRQPGPISTNVASQKKLYASAGDAVIDVFTNLAGTSPIPEVIAQGTTIQTAMVAEINKQGPGNVSKHCADPTQISVVDVGKSSFNASNTNLFYNSVSGRATNVLNEPQNNCYHVELNAN